MSGDFLSGDELLVLKIIFWFSLLCFAVYAIRKWWFLRKYRRLKRHRLKKQQKATDRAAKRAANSKKANCVVHDGGVVQMGSGHWPIEERPAIPELSLWDGHRTDDTTDNVGRGGGGHYELYNHLL